MVTKTILIQRYMTVQNQCENKLRLSLYSSCALMSFSVLLSKQEFVIKEWEAHVNLEGCTYLLNCQQIYYSGSSILLAMCMCFAL